MVQKFILQTSAHIRAFLQVSEFVIRLSQFRRLFFNFEAFFAFLTERKFGVNKKKVVFIFSRKSVLPAVIFSSRSILTIVRIYIAIHNLGIPWHL